MDLNYFWELNPNQLKKYINVYEQRKKNEAREIDMLNHILGQYIGAAVNSPKKYPRKPLLFKESKPKEMTGDEMEEIAKRLNQKFGGLNK